jgi:hypothetical protein|tara:strand:+ start:85539 stop:86687 length:1149 start_codon:yes stop_codon:yes gene_type:complete
VQRIINPGDSWVVSGNGRFETPAAVLLEDQWQHRKRQKRNWEYYDEENGTNMAERCNEYPRNEYDVGCAESSQWFFDRGMLTKDEISVGHVTPDTTVDYNGIMIQRKRGVLPNSASKTHVAHEVGHLLGFKHSDGAGDLMNTGIGEANDNISHDNLHDMLDKMNLECRWTMEVHENMFFINNASTCPGNQCIANMDGNARIDFTVESYDDNLIGKGTVNYNSVKYPLVSNSGNCSSSAVPKNGNFKLTGNIQSISGSSLDFITADYPMAYTLEIKTDYSQEPQENATLHTAHGSFNVGATILKNFLSGGGFDSFKVILGDPNDPKNIIQDVNFSSKAPSVNKGCINLTQEMKSDDLAITKVETFKRETILHNFQEYLEDYFK